MPRLLISAICLLGLILNVAWADSPAPGSTSNAQPAKTPKSVAPGASTDPLSGAWGGAIAILHNQETVYSNVTTPAGTKKGTKVIQIGAAEDYRPQVMLAYHYYGSTDLDDHNNPMGTYRCSIPVIGACIGGVLAFGVGSDNESNQVINAAVIGPIIGWGNDCDVQNQKFNIGWVWGRRFGVQTLAPGFHPGQVIAASQAGNVTQQRDVNVNGLFFSFTWGSTNPSAGCTKAPSDATQLATQAAAAVSKVQAAAAEVSRAAAAIAPKSVTAPAPPPSFN